MLLILTQIEVQAKQEPLEPPAEVEPPAQEEIPVIEENQETAEKTVVAVQAKGEDAVLDATLRPKCLRDFIGQENIKKR